MKDFILRGTVTVEVATRVQAKNIKKAEKMVKEAIDREVSICIHGSEFAEDFIPNDEWVLKDGTTLGSVEFQEIEES